MDLGPSLSDEAQNSLAQFADGKYATQVILSLQLTFAVVPMVHFTTSRAKMGRFVNGWIVTIIAILVALIIAGLNAYLVIESAITNEFGQAVGGA